MSVTATWKTEKSQARRALLMELPAGALAEFLSCRDLRVASEDTVLLTVARRVEHLKQLGKAESEIQQERKQLMEVVRMPQLMPAALAFIAPKLPGISQQQCTNASFLRDCRVCVSHQHHFKAPALWFSGPHASCPKASHTMEFDCSLAEIQSACSSAMASSQIGRHSQVGRGVQRRQRLCGAGVEPVVERVQGG